MQQNITSVVQQKMETNAYNIICLINANLSSIAKV